jgi:hypothetical protein
MRHPEESKNAPWHLEACVNSQFYQSEPSDSSRFNTKVKAKVKAKVNIAPALLWKLPFYHIHQRLVRIVMFMRVTWLH